MKNDIMLWIIGFIDLLSGKMMMRNWSIWFLRVWWVYELDELWRWWWVSGFNFCVLFNFLFLFYFIIWQISWILL